MLQFLNQMFNLFFLLWDDPLKQWSFRGGTRGNAVPIVKFTLERMGTAGNNVFIVAVTV